MFWHLAGLSTASPWETLMGKWGCTKLRLSVKGAMPLDEGLAIGFNTSNLI
ncbi:hypothetical protein HN51_036496, partial [Arachis hypogaea]